MQIYIVIQKFLNYYEMVLQIKEVFMNKGIFTKIFVWLMSFSLVLSLMPYDLFIAHAETGETKEDIKKETSNEDDPVSTSSKNETDSNLAKNTIEEEDLLSPDDLQQENISVQKTDKAGVYQANIFDNQVMKKDEKGKWAKIDPSLSLKDGKISTKNTDINVKFNDTLSDNSSFINLNEGDEQISVTLSGMEYDNKVRAPKTRKSDIKDNTIWYKGIFPNIDVRHVVLNNEVKEDIVLNNNQKGLQAIQYKIKTTMEAHPTTEGTVEFTNKKGEVAFTMPRPEMSDSKIDEKSGLSTKSYDIKYEVYKEKDGYLVKVVPDQKWLDDKERRYPVYIDPSFAKDATLDTFVSSALPTSNLNQFWNSTLGEYVLRIGKYDTATGTNYAFLKFPSMTQLLGASVSAAKMQSYVKWNYNGATPMDVWADKANATWSETGVTWDTKPTSTNITKDAAAVNEWLSFNVLTYVKGIATGSKDYGLKLHANGNGMTYWKQLTASENAANKSKISVTYSYPKMQAIKTEPSIITGTSTGSITATWPAIQGAKGYRLQMYDGKGWQTIYTGTSTSFSTKGKGIWPTTAQYTTKDTTTQGIKFRAGDGTDLPIDPSSFYTKSTGATSTDKTFQFRVITDYALGSGTPSDVDQQSLAELIPATPALPSIKSVTSDANDNAEINISWPGVAGATKYNVFLYNGNAYEKIDTVTGTSWSSKDKKIYPTAEQMKSITATSTNIYRLNNDGVQLPGNPLTLFNLNGTKTAKNYSFRITAASTKGESAQSSTLKVYVPTQNVSATVDGYPDNRNENSGFLMASWNKVLGADGYGIYLFNGKDYELVDVLGKDVTTWHTRDKKLWPVSGQYQLNKDGVVGGGRELPLDPSPTYITAGGENDKNYKVKITSFRNKGAVTDKIINNYFGESAIDDAEEKLVEIKGDSSTLLGDEDFYPTIDTELGSYNTFNNNQTFTETDGNLPGRGPDVDAERTFNSKSNKVGMFGLGWQSSFERKLSVGDSTTVPKVAKYIEADGSEHLFLNNNGKLLPPTGIDYDFLIEDTNFVIQDDAGVREVYSKEGLLDHIEYDATQADKKNSIKFNYKTDDNEDKRLISIYSASDAGDNATASEKNRITFEYNAQNLVSKMSLIGSSNDNTGTREYTYQYDKYKRLISVKTPSGDYTYSYREKYAVDEAAGEVQPTDVSYPTEIDVYGMPDNTEGSHQISATYDDDTLKSIKDETGITTNFNIDKEDDGSTATLTGSERTSEKYTFDKVGHLTEEFVDADKDKTTKYEWKDHRITKTINPDGTVQETSYSDRQAANSTGTELDGQITKEKDSTSQTTYEYAANKDDIIKTTDTFGITNQDALNSDREAITDYSAGDQLTGFTEYNKYGNLARTSKSVTSGANYVLGGGFDNSGNKFSKGTLTNNGVHGQSLKLTSETATQDVTMKAGDPYNISGSFKLTDTASATINLVFVDSSGKDISTTKISSPKVKDKWIRKYEEVVAPTGTVKGRVELTATSGTVYFDEIQLESAKAGHSTSISPFNFIDQGGFDSTSRWTLTNGKTGTDGFESSDALVLSANGSASQTLNVIQSSGKGLYVTVLAKNASSDDKIKVTATDRVGTQTSKESSFQTLDQNKDLWQRQTVQLNAKDKSTLATLSVQLVNGSGETIFDGVRVSEGISTQESQYDKQNNQVTDLIGYSKTPVSKIFDGFGNMLSTKQGTHTVTNSYDNNDNLTKTTTENGAIISYEYNAKNQLSAQHFEGQDTKYSYTNNRITSITTADGEKTEYSYNPNTGNLTKILLPSGKSIVSKFDGEGNLTAINDGTDDLFTYTYEKTGNVSQINDNKNNLKKTYEYDNSYDGIFTNDTNAGNGAGRLLKTTDYFGVIQSYEYLTETDGIKTDLPSSMTFNNLKSVYHYDKVNRNDKIDFNGLGWTFRHYEDGRVVQTKMPGGEATRSIGDNDLTESITSDATNGNVIDEQYEYDQYDNIIKKTSKDKTTTYKYDNMNQLIEEKTDDKITTYSYDKRGNRIENGSIKATFNSMNQLVSYDGKTVSYDKDGNRTSDDKYDYSWNSLGQLVKVVKKSDNDTWNYQYDELGRRITKTHNSEKTNYHYDGDSIYLIGESQNGQIIRTYIRDQNGKLLALKIGDKVYNYHTNSRGDVIGLSDQDGNIQATYEYDSWGNITKSDVKDTALKNQPFKYASYFYDEETNQYYLNARYYNPQNTSFLSIDPDINIENTVTMSNGYNYANNNPISYTDINGRLVAKGDDGSSGGGTNNAGGGGFPLILKSNKPLSYIAALGKQPNTLKHILAPKHRWNEISSGKWSDVERIMSAVMRYGKESRYQKTGFKKVYTRYGRTVVVTYARKNGRIYVGNGWVVPK